MYVLNILIASTLLISCKSAYVDNLEKCGIKDDECLKNLHQKVMYDIAKSGIPELNIPSIDPINVKNISITVLDTLNLLFKDAVVKGIKNCEFKKFHADLEKRSTSFGILCNVLTLKGHFMVSGSSPVVQSLIGGDSLNGEGSGKVKLENFKLDYTAPTALKKHDDGNIYMEWPDKKVKYKFDVEKATFVTEKVFIGKEDISKLVNNYLNENSKFILQNFGKVFMDKAMEYYFDFAKKFFNNVPINKLVSDDLSSYVA